ncbi:MAG: hypothetical protein ACI837_002793, partial [Crocinitomicaceae bacterium]
KLGINYNKWLNATLRIATLSGYVKFNNLFPDKLPCSTCIRLS